MSTKHYCKREFKDFHLRGYNENLGFFRFFKKDLKLKIANFRGYLVKNKKNQSGILKENSKFVFIKVCQFLLKWLRKKLF